MKEDIRTWMDPNHPSSPVSGLQWMDTTGAPGENTWSEISEAEEDLSVFNSPWCLLSLEFPVSNLKELGA